MVQKFKTLADAIALAEYAHRNQLDKAGLPYIDHPKRVLKTVQAQGAQPYVQIAAILHDTTEDTAFTTTILKSLGFSEAAVVLIRLLDRDYSEQRFLYDWPEYKDYDHTSDEYKQARDNYYYNAIKNHGRDAVIIKLADIQDNMLPWRQAYLEKETQDRLRGKYTTALSILNPAPVNHGLLMPGYVHDPYFLR